MSHSTEAHTKSTVLTIKSGSTKGEIKKEARIQLWWISRVTVFHQEKNINPLDDMMLTKLYSSNSLVTAKKIVDASLVKKYCFCTLTSMQLLQKHVSLQFWSVLSLFHWLIFKKEGNHCGKWNKILTMVPVISKSDNTLVCLLQLLIETQGLLTSARQMNSQRSQLIEIKPV